MKTLYKFETPNCSPCAALQKFIDSNPFYFEGFNIQKVDILTEAGQELVSEFRVRSSPTLVYQDDDNKVHVFVGFSENRSPEKLIEWVANLP